MTAEAVVMGLGVTGLSCVRHLHARGWRVAAMDSRSEPPALSACRAAFPDVPVHLAGWDDRWLTEARLIAVSPGISPQEPVLQAARARGADVAGDVELFAREARGAVAAITGTNGKSTVTSLVGVMLAAAGRRVGVGGNLGTPALDLLAEHPADGYVLELSSFQLELLETLNLQVACVLNVSADHLDRYGDLQSYAAAKQRIYRQAGVAVYNADDALTAPGAEFAGERIAVAADIDRTPAAWGVARRDGQLWLVAAGEPLVPCSSLRLAGTHNAFNAAAALAVVASLGVPAPEAIEALREYPGLPHRCVEVARCDGVRFVNDSKATNVGATLAAVQGLDDGSRRLVVIAGGDGKNADFTLLHEAFARHVHDAVLIGRDAPLLATALQGACDISFAATLPEAVERAAALAARGDTVVLAPACASFDMFTSFAQRGDVFTAAAQRLASGEGAS